MSVKDNSGYREALTRIEACKQEEAETLLLADLGLTEIPREIGELNWLKELSLDKNEISEISNLENLRELERFSLEQNTIKEIRGLETLTNLQALDPLVSGEKD
jgi:Leucine-rich repeat (LRR) protein